MAVPILGRRRERKQAELQAAIDAGVEKALSPALAAASQREGVGGATYPVPNPSSPFSQTGGNYGANPLPRPGEDFGSLFGPGYPLFPDALDPLNAAGRTGPRRYQYAVTENIQIGQFGAPWMLLRQIASGVDVVARCIELVQDSVAGMEWSWGFSRQLINQIRLEHNEPNSARATAIARVKYGDELARVQKFWERPDERMGYTFIQWLTLAVWAHLVFDGIAVYPQYTLGGDLHSLSILDTSTIKILLDNQGFLPRPPAPAYQQILWGFPRGEYQAETANGDKVPIPYQTDQLAYYIRRPRLHTVYGFSAVEESINYATLYQQRQEWMHAEWSHGSTPKGVIKTTDTQGWTPEQFAYFQQATNDQWSGQTQKRQNVMVLRPGMEWDQLKDFAELYNTNLDEWLVMQIGAKFGVPQSQLGIPMVLHNLNSGAQTQSSMDLADKFSIDSLVNFMIDCINDLTRRFMNVGPEITMTATYGNSDQSDLQRAQADASDVNNGIRTRNEVRAERGLPLISDPEADVLSETAGNALIFLPGQLAYQAASEHSELEENTTPTSAPNQSAPAKPKSKSKAAETTNRAVGHVASGTDMVSTGTDRKAKAANHNNGGKESNAPQPGSATGNYHEKELDTFLKFAKSRFNGTKNYRVFEFQYIDPATATTLNNAVYDGTLDDVKAIVSVIKGKKSDPAAGVLVRALDTGRVLMVQRSMDQDSGGAGKWEVPGGKLNDGEDAWVGATREWNEEVGGELPKGKQNGVWVANSGNFHGFIYDVKHETDIDLNEEDYDHHEIENVAWWCPEDLVANPAVRLELQSMDWSLLENTE